MARKTRQTTRRVNERVVESLQRAALCGNEALHALAVARQRVEEVATVTRAHDNLLREIDAQMKRLNTVQDSFYRHLAAERDGER